MQNIGIIESSRLKNIPQKHQAEHEFCFHIHDLMAHLLVQMEVSEAGFVAVELETEEDVKALQSSKDFIEFFEKTGKSEQERRVVINHLGAALFSDMLHFMHDAMIALEKRKFAVAFSLLRKPLKEGMVLAAQMCADEDAFFKRMKSDAKNLLDFNGSTSPDALKKLFADAMAKCRGSGFANAEAIYLAAFDRKNPAGLAPLFDKAMHLVTTNSHIATENYNLNFIFKNPLDNDIYEYIYPVLAVLFLWIHIMQIELYSRMKFGKKGYVDWLLFTCLGSYDALFKQGPSKFVRLINNQFAEFLNCPSCDERIRLTKNSIPRLLVAENLVCGKCHTSHHFPIGWLLSRLDLNIA
jgi:hypothetical protein